MKRSPQKSYTLIEMVMVIVIIGILAILAIPRFNNFYYIKLISSEKKLVSDIRYAQQVAVAEHTYTRIVFDTSTETYTAYKNDPSTGNWVNLPDPFTRGNLTENYSSDPKYQGINIASATFSSNTLAFDWQGIPAEGSGLPPTPLTADGSITLSYRGNTVSVTVTAQTGKVTM